ncbi:MAG: 3-phosphoshikimate 1-carboxyvinyltransferase [Bacteroidales bacterium]|nr:3-phosphoshikimate 1-carboxyvinyltransferase [Bacteroidales bacterium]
MDSSSNYNVSITLPASKSLSNRWLVMDYLSANGIKIKNLSAAADTQLLKRLFHQLRIGRRHTFDCRDAGTAARFLTAILAFTPGTYFVTGSERLQQRPMGPLVDALRSIGCQITCMGREGFLPLKIVGTVPRAERVVIDGSLSSQFVSALLQAAVILPQGIAVEVTGAANSEAFVAMTLNILSEANVEWSLKGVPPAYYMRHTLPRCDSVTIERDWSASSYFFSAQALKPSLRTRMIGLYRDSIQGDRAVKDIFSQLGVKTLQSEANIDLSPSKENCKKTFEWNFRNTPDLFPAVAVTCAALGVDAHLKGIENLRIKESDRVNAIAEELEKMNGKVVVTQDEMHVLPSKLCVTQPVNSHNDHRVAMAFAALKVKYPEIEVLNPNVVTKSFPNFWEMLDRMVEK